MAPCRSSTHKKTWPSHLGHNSIQTTSIYVRAEKRWLLQALDRYYDRGDNKADSLAKVDGPIDVIQKLLGHEFLQTTSIYVRAEKKRMMEVASEHYKKDSAAGNSPIRGTADAIWGPERRVPASVRCINHSPAQH
jgi:integrase